MLGVCEEFCTSRETALCDHEVKHAEKSMTERELGEAAQDMLCVMCMLELMGLSDHPLS
jgi:hypothetical protein